MIYERDNVNVHRAAANILQAEKAARPAAPCATYCYHAPVVWIGSASLLHLRLSFIFITPEAGYSTKGRHNGEGNPEVS